MMDESSGMLLIPKGKKPEDYSAWAIQVGKRSELEQRKLLSVI